MKKEIMILGCLIVIFWGLINFLYGKTNDIDNIQYKLNQNGNIAIMVYDNERESYLKQSNIPVGSYELESEKSYCVNGGEITGYDKTLGVITYNFFTSDKCYIYLKKIDLQTNISLDNNNSVVNYTLEYSKYPVRFVVSYVKNGENSNWTVVQDTVSNSGVVSGSIVANITGEITIKIGVYTIDDELLMTEYQKATVSAINTNTNVLLTNKKLLFVPNKLSLTQRQFRDLHTQVIQCLPF